MKADRISFRKVGHMVEVSQIIRTQQGRRARGQTALVPLGPSRTAKDIAALTKVIQDLAPKAAPKST